MLSDVTNSETDGFWKDNPFSIPALLLVFFATDRLLSVPAPFDWYNDISIYSWNIAKLVASSIGIQTAPPALFWASLGAIGLLYLVFGGFRELARTNLNTMKNMKTPDPEKSPEFTIPFAFYQFAVLAQNIAMATFSGSTIYWLSLAAFERSSV